MAVTAIGPDIAALVGIDPDEVDRLQDESRVLPSAFYTDPAIRKLEDQLIFRRAWQLVGTNIELGRPGDYVTAEIAGVPIVVVRDDADELHAFVNVCRHRAKTIMEGEGSCTRLQCSYHAWTYSLEGNLLGAPGFPKERMPSFETLSLRPVHVDSFRGLVFVSLEPEESLADQLGDLPELMVEAGYDFPFENPAESGLTRNGGIADYEGEVAGNWKVFYENSSECYHCPTIHPDTLCAVTVTEAIEFKMSSSGKFGKYGGLWLRPNWQERFTEPKAGSQYGFGTFAIWPNTILFTGWIGEHVTRYLPTGPGSLRYLSRAYTRPDISADVLDDLLDALFAEGSQEDIDVVLATQKGLESGLYEPGPLVEGREDVIAAFQRQVWSALRPAFR